MPSGALLGLAESYPLSQPSWESYLFGGLLACVVQKWLWSHFLFSFEMAKKLEKAISLGSLLEEAKLALFKMSLN